MFLFFCFVQTYPFLDLCMHLRTFLRYVKTIAKNVWAILGRLDIWVNTCQSSTNIISFENSMLLVPHNFHVGKIYTPLCNPTYFCECLKIGTVFCILCSCPKSQRLWIWIFHLIRNILHQNVPKMPEKFYYTNLFSLSPRINSNVTFVCLYYTWNYVQALKWKLSLFYLLFSLQYI